MGKITTLGLHQILAAYGDLEPSMLQDFELGRRTEIDFINGYVVQLGTQIGIPIAMNAAIADMVHQIEQGQIQPLPAGWMICCGGSSATAAAPGEPDKCLGYVKVLAWRAA